MIRNLIFIIIKMKKNTKLHVITLTLILSIKQTLDSPTNDLTLIL